MSLSDSKSVVANHNGKKVSGIYRREAGTFDTQKGAIKIVVTEYEYSFDFTVKRKRFRSVFGRESEYGKIGATGKWESFAIERAVEALLRFKSNAKAGNGPTSIKQEVELQHRDAKEKERQRQREKTVEKLVELFLEDIAVSAPNIKPNKPRTIKEYRLNLHRDVIPAIGTRKAKTIEREDISEIISKIVNRKKIVQANRTLSACSRLFNWAVSKGFVRYNPCSQMQKYDETPRHRVLTEKESKEASNKKPRHEEIKTLWQALIADRERTEAQILMLCILTGVRPGEICNMKWQDIDDHNWWSVHKDEIKTDVDLDCYLTATVLEVLGSKQKEGYVFTMVKDKNRPFPVRRLSVYVREEKEFLGLQPWQPRDLRRTFTTLSTSFGFSDVILNKAQARRDSSVIRVHYDKRRYYDELRQLFEQVEREILRIIGQTAETAKVITLRS